MQKVDLVIAGVGALALVATVLGIVFYEEAAGEQEVIFPESSQSEEDTASGEGPLTLTIPLPDNATAVENLVVTVDFTGTASPVAQGGTYELLVTPPNGTCDFSQAARTDDWSEDPVTFNLGTCRWMDPPAARSTSDIGSIDETVSWSSGFVVEVRITDPSGTAVPTVTEYTYTATVAADVMSYRATVEVPDPSGAQ